MPLKSAQPPSHFLVGAGSLEVATVLSQTPFLDSNSCHYAIVRGRGNGKNRGENCEHGEWGINRKCSNKTRVRGKEARHQHKDEGRLLRIPYSSNERMKTKSTHLAFIHRPFEGRLNPNFLP